MSSKNEPTPGSDAAVKRGCTCPVLDNGHGRGTLDQNGERAFWRSMDCPLHGEKLAGIEPSESDE